MSQIDWITEKSFGKYAKNAAQEELNSFYGIAKSMRDSGMDNEIIAENLKTMYGATPEQVERVQKEVLGKTAAIGYSEGEIFKIISKLDEAEHLLSKNPIFESPTFLVKDTWRRAVASIISTLHYPFREEKTADVEKSAIKTAHLVY